jgi:acyltransferase
MSDNFPLVNNGEVSLRNYVVDNARGIGILLIIIGHAPGLPKLANEIIYSFHVPLFFLLSGFSFKESMLNLRLVDYIKQLVKSLLIPFVFFWFVSYLYWLPTYSIGGNAALYVNFSIWTPFIGLLKADGASLPMNPALWFYTTLFFTSVFYWIFRYLFKNRIRCLAISLIVSVIIIYFSKVIGKPIIWNIDIALICLFFYNAGSFFKSDINLLEKSRFNIIELAIMSIFILVALIYFSKLNSFVDINKRLFGHWPFIFIFNGIIGSIFIFFVSKLIGRNKYLYFLSKNSLILFSTHMVSFRLLSAILIVAFEFNRLEFNNGLFNAIYSIWAILLLFPAIYIIRRWFPIVLGKR